MRKKRWRESRRKIRRDEEGNTRQEKSEEEEIMKRGRNKEQKESLARPDNDLQCREMRG